MTYRADTAIKILTGGIKLDPSDMDLYTRRAALYYSLNYTKRAMDDYLKILASGDSSVVYIKRAGIGYANNLQPRDAIKYLSLAHKKDTADYETLTYMAQNYNKLDDSKNAIKCYNKVVGILTPVSGRLGLTCIMLAETQNQSGLYKEAIETYLKAQKYVNDPNLYMIIGNIYDEKLNNPAKAITYYQQFLDNLKNARMKFSAEYIESISKRLEYLKNPPPAKKLP
jgi:tetratricopeptide (TPR) repeat protein